MSDRFPIGHNAPLHVVLLGDDPAWITDVQRQAESIGLPRFQVTPDPEKVLALLSGGFPPVSHLLLQPRCAGELLPELLDLTLGQTSGVTLVLLGAPDPAQIDQMPNAAVVVPHPISAIVTPPSTSAMTAAIVHFRMVVTSRGVGGRASLASMVRFYPYDARRARVVRER